MAALSENPCPSRARHGAAGHGKCGALARARYFPFLGRTDDCARCDDYARFRASQADRAHRKAHCLPGKYEKEFGSPRRPRSFAALLLALTQKGVSREEAYLVVQRNAMTVWRGEGDFLTLLKQDKDVRKALTESDLEELFDLGYHLKNVDVIFNRVFGRA
jgi:hypothetical protein